MKLVDTSIKKPVSVAVGVIFVVMFGVISLYKIPVQLTPDVEKPTITVDTTWEGGSPQEVETEVVRKQEDELKTVEGLVQMTSESQDGRGTIVLEFLVGTDLDAALVNVSNKLNQVREYPAEADRPVISSTDVRGSAMAWFILKPLPSNNVDINHFHDFAEDYIKPRFERVPGVGSSNVFGGREREMQVIVDPDALAARNITMLEMARAIDQENDNYSGGDFDEGKRRYVVRTIGEYKSPEDIEDVVITRKNGAPVYIRDVARVRLGYKDEEYAVRQNGEPAIAINAIKESGANSIEVMAGLKEAMDELNRGILKDRGITLYNVYNETGYIISAIDLVKHNLVIGGCLAIAVLLLFLRSGSSTLIIATAIPISVIGTFVMMALLGRTINVISLAGMSFAVGMVVDNSIVVLENIYRHMQMGKSRLRAAYDGTVEVWGAVLASTLTTAAVFLPVIFIEEQAGQLFRDIAIAISVSVILSLIVSITVIPAISAKILKIARGKEGKSLSNLWGYVDFAQVFADRVTNLVRRIMADPKLRMGVVCGFTFGAFLLSWVMMPKTEYLPEGNRNLIFGILLPPPGYNIQEFTDIGEQIEKDLRPYWEAKAGSPEAAKLDAPPIENFFYVARGRQVFMGAVAQEPDKVRELIPLMQRTLSKIPGMIAVVTQSSLFQRGLGEGRSINIQITGPELEKLVDIGQKAFFGVMQKIPGSQARPIPSLDLGSPEVQVVTDRVRASDVGLTNEELGFTVNALVDGAQVSDYLVEGDEIDLVLRGEDIYSSRTQDIEDLMINTPSGEMVTVGSVADVVVTTGPEQINHYERQRTIAIQVIPPDEMPLESAIETIEREIITPLRQAGELGGSYNVILTGTADDLTVTRQALQWNFLLAAAICFLLMSSLFESFLYPFVIMFSVPLAALGGFLGLAILNLFIYQALDVLTMLGFVILIGVVVNNAILIVHQALNNIREEGMELKDAVAESVKTRVRPIFMTTTTSVFGMLPLVLFPGSGSELYRGLGSVVVGGLVVSTLFTLFLVPAVFGIVWDAKENAANNWTRLRHTLGQLPSKLMSLF
ncbi:MAG TPA: efflux RND transporter permease subunit [Thermodesulfobacteriota bacterium]|nr:efflux RND transporter permease subunit [Thermodesulfobacteriota bacterium]